MKIKEICEKTGLTDRTVRYYIEEELISPFYTENYLGRKSFDFSEQDLERLKGIATLRAFGFSVEEIKQLSSSEAGSQQIVETVKKRTEETLDESRRRLNVLSTLDASDNADMSKLAKKLSNYKPEIEEEMAKHNLKKRVLSFVTSCTVFLAVWLPIISSIVVLLFRLFKFNTPIVRPVFLIYTLICFLPSMVTLFVLQKLKGGRKLFRTILTILCVLCLPLGIIFSTNSVIVCDHQYKIYRTLFEATCDNEGESVMKCEVCGSFETQKIEKLSHVSVAVKGVEPTCKDAGLSDGAVCSLCNAVLSEQVTLPATNLHKPVLEEAVPATCNNSGLSDGINCSVCQSVLLPQTVIPETGHIYKRQEIQQNCGTDGCILYECQCGDSYKTDVVRATNIHDFTEKSEGVGYVCRVCGLEAVAYGNVDRSLTSGDSFVKYYITGAEYSGYPRTLVIYGSGAMPDFNTGHDPAWIGVYLYQVDTVIIESGVTSVGSYAFTDAYYDTVRKFIIRSKNIRYDDNDFSFAGISNVVCDIIYDY